MSGIVIQPANVHLCLHMIKLYKFLYILWSLRDSKNRKKLMAALRKFLDEVKPNPISTTFSSPYKSEVLDLSGDPRILLVTHQLSRTGAPYAVLYLARALTSIYGVKPVVVSPEDGPLRENFTQEGFTIVVDPLLFKYQSYSIDACSFVAKFDKVIVTSLCSFDFIRYFRGIGKNLTWWLHETEEGFAATASSGVDLPLLFAVCESIWLGSPLCLPLAVQYTSQEKLFPLLYGCPDTAIPHKLRRSEKIIFLIAGTLEKRKGQDIFLEAVRLIPEELRSKAIFRIIGSPHKNDVAGAIFLKKLHASATLLPEVEFLENMSLDLLHEYYAAADVFVSASRDDPMPIVITQGLMYSTACLCSSAIGHAQLLEDGKNALIFSNDSANELAKKMTWAINNPSGLMTLGVAGRAVYEKYFLMSSFVANVENLIQRNKIAR